MAHGFARDKLRVPFFRDLIATVVGMRHGFASQERTARPATMVYRGYAATTDATVTTALTLTLEDNTGYMIELQAVARRTGGAAGADDDGAAYQVVSRFNWPAGVLTGNEFVRNENEDQAAWDAVLSVSGSTVLVRVTGAVDNDISWDVLTIVQRVAS